MSVQVWDIFCVIPGIYFFNTSRDIFCNFAGMEEFWLTHFELHIQSSLAWEIHVEVHVVSSQAFLCLGNMLGYILCPSCHGRGLVNTC